MRWRRSNHSSGSYDYVLGNPVRLGDKDGRDTTVYVYFDPASKYFGGTNNRTNRNEVLRGMKLLYH